MPFARHLSCTPFLGRRFWFYEGLPPRLAHHGEVLGVRIADVVSGAWEAGLDGVQALGQGEGGVVTPGRHRHASFSEGGGAGVGSFWCLMVRVMSRPGSAGAMEPLYVYGCRALGFTLISSRSTTAWTGNARLGPITCPRLRDGSPVNRAGGRRCGRAESRRS